MRQLTASPTRPHGPRLIGRDAERGVLDRLLEDVREGASRALVVHGEAGMGKTALLGYVAGRASDCRVVSVAGAQAEMGFGFAALHQFCVPVLDHLDAIPAPQRKALYITFGMEAGPVPDRLLVGLAVLSLLAEVAAERPFVCLIDDDQWLDQPSAQVLAFVARRLGTESVGLVFGSRTPSAELAGLAELAVGGLADDDAQVLLGSVLTGPVDQRVRDRIVAEAAGNPLALLELPRSLTAAELAGGFGMPGASALPGSVEESFRRRADGLPAETRRLLLMAAAEPLGDPVLVWRAAGRLGIGAPAAQPATEAGLIDFGARVRFRHPLVRSAAYRAASAQDRQQVHQALAEATDPAIDPDRRAWHLAQAAPGPNEDIAAQLERCAGRAQARGGVAATAAFLARATTLTPDPARQGQRALAAAQAKTQAGDFTVAMDLLIQAEAGPLSELEQARVDLVRAQLAFATSRGRDAPPLLLKAAKRLEPIDASLARVTYLDAIASAMFAGRLAGPDADLLAVARAASAAPPPLHTPGLADLLLDGLVATLTQGHVAGVPALRKALGAFGTGMPAAQELRLLWLGFGSALQLWDDERYEALSDRFLELAREVGALSELPIALRTRGHLLLIGGGPTALASVVDELQAAVVATGRNSDPYILLHLAAWRGNESEATALIDPALRDVQLRGEGLGMSIVEWAKAVLYNGLGRYRQALAAATRANEYASDFSATRQVLVELIEAAARSRMPEMAADALGRLAESTSASGTDWALGIQARSHALLANGEEADGLYCESIARLGRTRIRVELARAHLLYGEWLRRERRRGDAREQLRTAHQMLEAMGMEAFAERARLELSATGETVRKRSPATLSELTVQEAQVARLAREGLTNPEIGTRLFISARTVQYHLSKVFTKLNLTSRNQLSRALDGGRGGG